VSVSDSGREHGFGAPRLPALRFVRTASGSAPPRPRLQRHAPRLGGFIRDRGAPRSPRGHKNPRGSRLAVCSSEPPSVRCDSSCPWRGVCPQNIATVAITALCALSGAHVGVSRPRCRWQLYGWRHPTTPSREPHERSSYQSSLPPLAEGRFCRLSLPARRIPHPVAGRAVTGGRRGLSRTQARAGPNAANAARGASHRPRPDCSRPTSAGRVIGRACGT